MKGTRTRSYITPGVTLKGEEHMLVMMSEPMRRGLTGRIYVALACNKRRRPLRPHRYYLVNISEATGHWAIMQSWDRFAEALRVCEGLTEGRRTDA